MNLKPYLLPVAGLVLGLAISTATLLSPGCATLAPGADPLVVRTEQGLSTANATFDFLLHVDNADRGFWRTNAPAMHNFCEWLRTPLNYQGSNVARCVEMQLQLDDLKLAYKASKTANASNSLYVALGTFTAVVGQVNAWSNVITSPIKP